MTCLEETESSYSHRDHTHGSISLDIDEPQARADDDETKFRKASISPNTSKPLQEASSEDFLLPVPSSAYSSASAGVIVDTATSRNRNCAECATGYQTATIALPSVLNINAQNGFQLLQRFFDLHIGASSSAQRLFPFEVLDTNSPVMVTTRSAIQTLCVAQIATSFNDPELMKVARSLYSESVRSLSSQMGSINLKNPNKIQINDIIGGIQALTSCAWFKGIETDELEWMQYTQTTLKILDVFSWNSIDTSTRRAFYYNWMYRAFFDALIKRTKVAFAEPPEHPTMQGRGPQLIEHAFDVPGLLWRTDRFVDASKSTSIDSYIVIRLLTEIGACLSRLKDWNLQWTRHYPPNSHYRAVGIKTFKDFKTLCGEHLKVFPLAYDFSNALHERDLRIFSMCILNLSQAIVDVNKAFPALCNSEQFRVQLREAESSSESCAADLCMLIPWGARPQNMAFASIHSFLPLHFASTYYEKQGKLPQLAWCRKVKQSLSTKYGIEIKYPT